MQHKLKEVKMTTSEKFELVHKCETAEELHSAVLQCAENGVIQGRNKEFEATRLAENVYHVIEGVLPFTRLTRNYGIRQQAIYIAYYENKLM
jgi:cytoskeletal protein CcmA (bactofilin family)